MSTSLTDRSLANALVALANGVHAGATLGNLLGQPAIAATMPRQLVDPLRTALGRGETAVEAFRSTRLLLRHELALLEASERTGNLEAGLARVAAGIERRRRDARNLVASLAYPTFLIAASSVILPLPMIITEGVVAYLARAAWVPLVLGAVVFVFLIWLPRLPATDPRRELPRRLARRTPFLQGALRRADAGMFAHVLGQGISAGLGIYEAFDTAVDSIDDARIRRAAKPARRRMEQGGTLTDALQAMKVFQPEVAALVAQGELTGTLDRSLERIAEQETDAGRRAVRRFLLGTVGLVYTVVMLFIAWRIVTSFVGVLDTLDQALEF